MQDRQICIFDFQKHYNKHFDFKDALVSLNELINWETFLPILKEGIPRVGRKAYDSILMIKIIILKPQYNLSDDQTEYQIYDRYSFRRFLGLEVGEYCLSQWFIRCLIPMEYDLIGQRMSWMVISQSFLFSAIAQFPSY
jgi:Transposase domain (DUF772)